MAEWEECRSTKLLVETVVDIDVLAVERSTTLGTVVGKGWIVLETTGKRNGQFSALRLISMKTCEAI